MAPPWLQSVNGWAFLSENDDQLILCRTAITHDRYLSLSQPIKHRKFIKILSCEVIASDRIFHLNVQGCNTVFCRRDPQGEQGQESYRLGQSVNLSPWQSHWRGWPPTSRVKGAHGSLFLGKWIDILTERHGQRKQRCGLRVKGERLVSGV